jgi:hypothetical protein
MEKTVTVKFTDEQQAAIDLAAKGESFSLIAPAGSGKSATAVGMGQVLRKKKVLYLVYNTAARKEAEEKFKKAGMTWVDVRTTSQIAWREYAYIQGANYGERMKPRATHVPATEIRDTLGLHDIDFGGNLVLSGYTQAVLAERAIERFCNSARPEITYKDVDLVVAGVDDIILDAARKHIAKLANRLWKQCVRPDSGLRFTMNHAFKLVASGGVNYGYDVVLVDEAQDSNDATMRFITNQVGAQAILIGDPAQALYCQPLGTQVEVVDGVSVGSQPAKTKSVAIEELKVGDRVVTYDNTHLWRRGREITHITRFGHDGEMVKATTESGLTSSYTPKHNCIVRIDDNLADKHVVYLMRRGDQYRIGRTRMMYSSQHKGFGVVLRGRREKADAVWILSLHDSVGEASLMEMLTQHEFNIPGVHFESVDGDVVNAAEFWRKLGSNKDSGEKCLASFGRLVESPLWTPDMQHRMGIRVAFPTAAANVMDGMKMLPLRNVDRRFKGKAPRHVWEEVTVEKYYYVGDVVSLEVDEHHNYFGDGILTHNSWRGATDQIMRHKGEKLYLTQSFRFGDAVAEEAGKHLVHTETGVTIKGLPSINDQVTEGDMVNPDVVLTRTNGGAMEWAISYLAAGKRVALVKGTDTILNLAYAAADLMKGVKPKSLELSAFKTWQELVQYTDEPGGAQFKPLVRLVQTHGVHTLIDACKKMVKYDAKYPRHDVAVTTCHSIKGLEWDNVQIGDDFFEPRPFENPLTNKMEPGVIDKHEAMIHYVAVTRARRHLDRHGLAWIDEYGTPAGADRIAVGG